MTTSHLELELSDYPAITGLFSPKYNPVPDMLQAVRPYAGSPFNLLFAWNDTPVEAKTTHVEQKRSECNGNCCSTCWYEGCYQ